VHTIRRLYYHISLEAAHSKVKLTTVPDYSAIPSAAHPPPLMLARNATTFGDPITRNIARDPRSQGLARPALKEVSDWLSLQRGAFSLHLGPSSVQPPGPTRTLKIANHSYYLLLSRRYRLFHCDICAFQLFLTQPFAPLSLSFSHPFIPSSQSRPAIRPAPKGRHAYRPNASTPWRLYTACRPIPGPTYPSPCSTCVARRFVPRHSR
jgi:hypothetical protein